MDINELRVFVTVAQKGTVTRAAKALGYVQSNVTARIQQLEAELNTRLFYRNRGMFLTPDGEKFLSYAERILQLMKEAEAALTGSDEPSGRLAIGANPKVATLYLPKILAQFHKDCPNVHLSLISGRDEELVQKVRHYELDVAFTKSVVGDDSIRATLVFEEELVLIANSDTDDLDTVFSKPFLMNSRGCVYRTQLENWLKSQGIGEVRIMEFNQLDAIIEGVAAGLGSSLVPQSAVQKYKNLVVKSFTVPQPFSKTKTFLIRQKDSQLTSALEKFIEVFNSSVYPQDKEIS